MPGHPQGRGRSTVTQRESEHRPPVRVVPPIEDAFKAGAHAPARTSLTANPNINANPRTNSSSPTQRHRELGLVLLRWLTPPNPRAVPPPSWDQLKWNGDHGRQAPTTGWPRTASVIWTRTVALPGRAVAIWLDWIVRSPSRFLAVYVLYALVAHLPGMGWLPWPY